MEKGYFDDKTRRKLFNYCLLIGIIFLIASIIVLTFCKGVYSCKEPSRFEKQEQLDEAMRNNPDEAAVSIEAKDICKVRKTDCNFHIVSVVLILVSLIMIFVLKSSVYLNLMKLLRKTTKIPFFHSYSKNNDFAIILNILLEVIGILYFLSLILKTTF